MGGFLTAMPTTQQMQSGPQKCALDLQFQKQLTRSSKLHKNVFIKPKSWFKKEHPPARWRHFETGQCCRMEIENRKSISFCRLKIHLNLTSTSSSHEWPKQEGKNPNKWRKKAQPTKKTPSKINKPTKKKLHYNQPYKDLHYNVWHQIRKEI